MELHGKGSEWARDETTASDDISDPETMCLRLVSSDECCRGDFKYHGKPFLELAAAAVDPTDQKCRITSAIICPFAFREACGTRDFDHVWRSFVQVLGYTAYLQELTVLHPRPKAEESRPLNHRCFYLHSLLSDLSPRLPKLRVIRLENEQVAEPNHINAIATMFAQAVSVEELDISRLYFPHVWPTDSVSIDPIVHSLSKLKRLRKVRIGRTGVSPLGSLVSKNAINAVMGPPCLEEIHMVGMNLSSSTLQSMCEGLATSHSVKRVVVGERISIEQERGRSPKVALQVGLEIAKLMTGNCFIENLTLFGYTGHHSAAFTYSLKQAEAFCAMNRSGRDRVYRTPNAPLHDWIHLMAAAGGDVNALYHVLLQNPGLCYKARISA